MQNEQTHHNSKTAIASSEEKARLCRTAMLTQTTIDHILLNQELAQSVFPAEKHTQETLSGECFSAEFLGMRLNKQKDVHEPVFTLREPDGTFFGYFYESALDLIMPTADKIMTSFVVLLAGEDEGDRNYAYTDQMTGRQFLIRRSMGPNNAYRFLMGEMEPNGRMFDRNDKPGNRTPSWVDDRIKELDTKYGPNGLMAALKKHNIDPQSMIFTSASYSVNSIFHSSLESCAEAIAQAIADNKRYKSYRDLSTQEKASLDHQQKISSMNYWTDQLETAKAAQNLDVGLFKGCYLMFGKPVKDENKKRILAYLNTPSEPEWNEIRGLSIVGPTTLWQAWVMADETAPRSGTKGFPSPDTLRNAIRHAVENNRAKIENKLEEIGPTGLRLC